jgi:hypothetical protein
VTRANNDVSFLEKGRHSQWQVKQKKSSASRQNESDFYESFLSKYGMSIDEAGQFFSTGFKDNQNHLPFAEVLN